jgi:drug/metabolite transporter (DMT)-like permease
MPPFDNGLPFKNDLPTSIGSPSDSSLTPGAALLIALLCTMFGANAVAIKYTLTGLGPFSAAALRFSLGAVFIAVWAYWRGLPFAIAAPERRPLFILALLFAVQINLFYLGMARTYASRAALIVNLVPFFVLIMAHFFIPGDRLSLRKIGGILLGFCGVALLITEKGSIGGQLRSGDLIVLTATVLWSANAIYTKKVIHRFAPFQIVLYPMLAAIGVFTICALCFEGRMARTLNLPIAAALIYQSLAVSAFGLVAWNTLLERFGAGTLHSFVFIMPVAGVLFSGLFLAEPITSRLLVAALLITAGILVIHLRRASVPARIPVERGW